MGRKGDNIHKRADGRWEARLAYQPAPDQKKVVKSFYGSDRQEAERKRNAFLEDLLKEMPVPDDPVPSVRFMREVAMDWLAKKRTMVKESSFACYTNQLNHYILPRIGDKEINRVDTECLNAFLDDLQANGLSLKTATDIRSLVINILKHAYEVNDIENVPECRKVPRSQPNVDVLMAGDQILLEKAVFASREPICIVCALSLFAGIRIGETCGLQWKDIDFVSKTIAIKRTVIRISNTNEENPPKTRVVIQLPKTQESFRVIPIPDTILDYLWECRAEDDIYLATGTGKFTEPRLSEYRFKSLLKRCGSRDYKFHSLRHTFATRCVEHGVDAKTLSEILGHSSVGTTMQRYVHPSMEMKRNQINKVPRLSDSGQIHGQE